MPTEPNAPRIADRTLPVTRRVRARPGHPGGHAAATHGAPAGASVPTGGPVGRVPQVTAGLLLASAAAGGHAAWSVRRMRRRAAGVQPLVHDVDLPGRFPPRFLVMLGDSAAAGHGLTDAEQAVPRRVARALVAADGRATAVRSVAVDGATTEDVRTTQVAAARGAEVILLGVGANDALDPRRSRDALTRDTHELLDALRDVAAEDAQVVFHTCPDLSVAPSLPALLRPAVGWRCRRTAEVQAAVAALHGVAVADLPREQLPPEVFGSDGFHPGERGHARMAERVVELLAASAPNRPTGTPPNHLEVERG